MPSHGALKVLGPLSGQQDSDTSDTPPEPKSSYWELGLLVGACACVFCVVCVSCPSCLCRVWCRLCRCRVSSNVCFLSLHGIHMRHRIDLGSAALNV
jgi:hypothetical protein